MTRTAAERLEEVNTAISKILCGGQSYQIDSRKVTRADLSFLRQMQKELQTEAELEARNSGGILEHAYVAYFDGR